MLNNKNLIEIVKIDGLDVAIERRSNNCWVSLTDMAKRYGKKPTSWLRLPNTKEYLKVLSDVRKLHITNENGTNLIITRKGNSSEIEQGTWCTDYRIAMRFAQWLDPRFSVAVDDLLVRIMQGESIVSNDDFLNLGGRQWVSCAKYCSILKKTPQSFYGLIGHYKKDFVWWDGQWYMSRELFGMKDIQSKFENHRLDIKSKYDENQLQLPFVEEIKEG